jgi:general stress protein 26
MKSRIVTVRLCAGTVLLCCASTAFTVLAQQKQFSRDQLIATAREIMTTTRYCALITIDARGRANARTMDAFAPDDKMVVWFGTNPLSRKVAEIRRHPRVTLYYFDRENQAYVTLHGIARLVNDPQEKLRHWKDDWKDFYPDRNKGYLLIEVRPSRLEVVNTKTGIAGKSRTWNSPSVIFAAPKQKRA